MKFTNLHKIIALLLIIVATFISSYFITNYLREKNETIKQDTTIEGMDNSNSANYYDSFNSSFYESCVKNDGKQTDCSNIVSGIIQNCSKTLNPADYKSCSTNISNVYIQNMKNSQTSFSNTNSNIPGSSIFSSLANTMDKASTNINNPFSNLDPNQNNKNPSSIITTSNHEQILATTKNTVDGIPSSQIPQGQEHLYILKTEIVPPICPACPNVIINDNLLKSKCQPCPSCERCPEPAFDCKKVPNYAQGQLNSYLPRAILNDFSQFV